MGKVAGDGEGNNKDEEDNMLSRTKIAARIGDAQYRLANGEDSIEVEAELIRLRKEIVASIPPDVDQGEEILAGYRADAMAQLDRLYELFRGLDNHNMSDLEMFHLSAGCELARQKVIAYFNLRNRMAEARIAGGTN